MIVEWLPCTGLYKHAKCKDPRQRQKNPIKDAKGTAHKRYQRNPKHRTPKAPLKPSRRKQTDPPDREQL